MWLDLWKTQHYMINRCEEAMPLCLRSFSESALCITTLIWTANVSICVKKNESVKLRNKKKWNKWIDAAPEVLCFFSFVRTQEAVLLASNHGCVFPSVCVCVWSHCCRCSCSRFHLPPSPPFTGLINKTASAAPSDPLPGSLSSSDQILMCDTKLAH